MSDEATLLAERVRHLQEVTSKATVAPTVAEIARVLVEEGVAALGGEMAALYLIEGDELVVAHWVGPGASPARARLPIAADVPVALAVRTRRPVWLADRSHYAASFPGSAARAAATIGTREIAIACLPLIAGDQVIGCFVCAFGHARVFSADERAFLVTITQQCAVAIERLRLITSERELRVRAESLVAAMARLQDLAGELSLAVSLDEVARVFLDTGRAVVGAFNAGVWMVEGDEAVVLGQVGYSPAAAALISRIRFATTDAPLSHALATGKPVFLDSRDAARRQFAKFEARTVHLADNLEAIACIPMVVDGRVLGAVGFGWSEPHAFDPPERELLLLMVRQAGQAMARARLHAAQEHSAIDLARLYAAEAAARRDAENANRTKDEFLAMLGHELRNPLAPIASALQVMHELDPHAFARERAIVERQVQHLVRLVDDLLDVSRIARGKVTLRRAPVELALPVAQAVEATRPLVEERGHAMTIEVPPGLIVDADLDRVAQMIANLITNAARYSPRGTGVVITAARDGTQIRLAVRDSGPGIPAALLPNLFKPFVQGERNVDRAEGGLGLGLAIVRNLAELHGGRVAAANLPGGGAEVAIWLPSAPPAPLASGKPASGRTGSPPRRALRVLVVDDNVDAAEMLGELLRVFGHEPIVVHDAAEALAHASPAPDVAFLDIGLPDLDGYELARRLRALPGFDHASLVALTGYGQASDRANSRAAGFAEHLVKPVDVARLRAILDAVAASPAA